MPAVLNIAVLGLGRMGKIYAQTIARQASLARLYAVADPEAQARADLSDRIDVPRVFEEAREALALPDLHAVVIATPSGTHGDLVTAAAEAGKAIFCEKPLALTLAETRRALDAVERAGVPLQVGFMRRFDAGYRQAKTMIDHGLIGRPVTFKAVGRDPCCPRPDFADPAHSGGLILDMGIHDFDLARWLMGSEVERVTAEGTLLVCDDLRAVGDFDNAVINLRFDSGALGNVEVSRTASYGYDVRTEVLGAKGIVRVGGTQQAPPMLSTQHGASDDAASYLMNRFGEAYRAQLHHFVDCVREDQPPAVSGADALAAFEISLAATYAAQTGQPVTLEAVRGDVKREGAPGNVSTKLPYVLRKTPVLIESTYLSEIQPCIRPKSCNTPPTTSSSILAITRIPA